MKPLAEFEIPFSGLKIGQHAYDFELFDAFFEAFGEAEFRNANVLLNVLLEKKETMLQLNVAFNGTVETDCDRCGHALEIPVNGTQNLVVKFGREAAEESDEIWVIPDSDHSLNIAWFAYECVVLSLPTRRVHNEGDCDAEALERLEQFRIDEPEEPQTDPRWAALEQLKNKN